MKLHKFEVDTFKRFYLLPTIILDKNNAIYGVDNFTIEIHFICFHVRWLWLRKEENA